MQDIVKTKIEPFASQLIIESLGELEPELLTAVTEHIGAHKSAAELAEELEPVSPNHPRPQASLVCSWYRMEVIRMEVLMVVDLVARRCWMRRPRCLSPRSGGSSRSRPSLLRPVWLDLDEMWIGAG